MLVAIKRMNAKALQHKSSSSSAVDNKNHHTVLISHKDTLLSAEHVARVFENGRKAALFTESACPLKVDKHCPLYWNFVSFSPAL